MTPKFDIFVQCIYLEVSSSYVYSFGSYRVDKQTNKHTNKQTDAAENIQCSSLPNNVGYHSVTHSLKLFDAPGTEAFALGYDYCSVIELPSFKSAGQNSSSRKSC